MTNRKYVHWRPENDEDPVTAAQIVYNQSLVDYLRPWLKPRAWILDYGTGFCGFLRVARDAGYQVEGVNPCIFAADWARRHLGITVHATFGQDFETDKRYDLVVSEQTFEHLAYPRDDLEKISSLLKEEGLAYINVPNWWTLRRFLHGADYLKDISHYNYFTPTTLAFLCRNAGFKVLKMAPAIAPHPLRRMLKRLVNPLRIGSCSVLIRKMC